MAFSFQCFYRSLHLQSSCCEGRKKQDKLGMQSNPCQVPGRQGLWRRLLWLAVVLLLLWNVLRASPLCQPGVVCYSGSESLQSNAIHPPELHNCFGAVKHPCMKLCKINTRKIWLHLCLRFCFFSCCCRC